MFPTSIFIPSRTVCIGIVGIKCAQPRISCRDICERTDGKSMERYIKAANDSEDKA